MMALPLNTNFLDTLTLPFSLHWLPSDACLVGGAVRDAFLKRQRDYLDLDFVLPSEAVETARRIARHYQAGFVVLDAERQIARVVFKTGTADFAQIEGKDLATDLQRRDFTVNAIAYNLHRQELIDPLHGLQDLQQGVLRMVSPKNLQDDPLRLLRAYRQAAQLQFAIAPDTRCAIRRLAPLIATVAAERVQTELGYLLDRPEGSLWIVAAWEDGLLPVWLPTATDQKVQQVAEVDVAVRTLSKTWSELGKTFNQPITSNASSWQALAKLACLVASDPDKAESELVHLKYSRAEMRAVVGCLRHLSQLAATVHTPMNLREQYFFFQEARDIFPCLVLVAIATGVPIATLQPLIERYLNPNDPVAYPQPLVSGKEVMRSLSLSPSPLIGKLLTEIQIAYIEGKVSTPEEALQFAASIINS